jgi:hypothetical protein
MLRVPVCLIPAATCVCAASSPAQRQYASVRDIQVVTVNSAYVNEVQEVIVAGAVSGKFVLFVTGTASSIGPFNHNVDANAVASAVQSYTASAFGCWSVSVTRTSVCFHVSLLAVLRLCTDLIRLFGFLKAYAVESDC